MADQFYDDIPARANNIGTDIDQIEYSLGWIKDFLQACGTWHDSSTTGVIMGNRGALKRCQLKWKDADEIYLEPGWYHHAGSTGQMVYWDSQLTFQLGSGGSNASSEDLDAGAQEVQYLYLDDSAIVTAGTNVITNSEIINSSTPPAWTVANHGWYPASATNNVQTTDRCIGAVLINASNEVVEFYHDGGLLLQYADGIEDQGLTDVDTGWATTVTLSIPGFCRKALCSFEAFANGDSDDGELQVRVGSQTGTTGVIVCTTNADRNRRQFNTVEVHTSTTQTIDLKHSVNGAHQAAVHTQGWYFPIGM